MMNNKKRRMYEELADKMRLLLTVNAEEMKNEEPDQIHLLEEFEDFFYDDIKIDDYEEDDYDYEYEDFWEEEYEYEEDDIDPLSDDAISIGIVGKRKPKLDFAKEHPELVTEDEEEYDDKKDLEESDEKIKEEAPEKMKISVEEFLKLIEELEKEAEAEEEEEEEEEEGFNWLDVVYESSFDSLRDLYFSFLQSYGLCDLLEQERERYRDF